MRSKFILFTVLLLSLMTCAEKIKINKAIEPSSFDLNKMKPVIQELGKGWSRGLKGKDVSVFKKLYDSKAHYLPDGENAIHGNQNIAAYWEASMDFVSDIQLTMETLEGNKDLLCETGNGIALILNQSGGNDTLHYKYVNVWKKQADGTYKVVIDTYNDIKR